MACGWVYRWVCGQKREQQNNEQEMLNVEGERIERGGRAQIIQIVADKDYRG